MKRGFGFFAALMLGLMVSLSSSSAYAQDEGRQPLEISEGKIGTEKKLGIGLGGGFVSGLSLKYFLSPSTALQVGIGGGANGTLGLSVDYLIHPFVLTEGSGVTIPLYFGGGIGLGRYAYLNNGTNGGGINLHVPLGVAFELEKFPLDIFLQAEPGFGVSNNGTFFFWGGTSGIRLYF